MGSESIKPIRLFEKIQESIKASVKITTLKEQTNKK